MKLLRILMACWSLCSLSPPVLASVCGKSFEGTPGEPQMMLEFGRLSTSFKEGGGGLEGLLTLIKTAHPDWTGQEAEASVDAKAAWKTFLAESFSNKEFVKGVKQAGERQAIMIMTAAARSGLKVKDATALKFSQVSPAVLARAFKAWEALEKSLARPVSINEFGAVLEYVNGEKNPQVLTQAGFNEFEVGSIAELEY